ncbi:hypothetical protein C8R47DRAFT_1276684 [Mycena vitilis]|nr:hypothetical protein C8R47DRAFT_1276684 [Mycena vitilis]
MSKLAFFLLLVGLVNAQASCNNYGIQNGASCLCPTGFGGAACDSPGCGGTIFQGSSRALPPQANNITDAKCACQAGWGGTGCNVCQTPSACQTAFSASGSAPSSSQSVSDGQAGQNSTLTYGTTSRVYAASQMSCAVVNPTLQSLSPGSSLNIIRTLQPGLSPLLNTTSFGAAGTVFAQLFYDGVEQFLCLADSCTQSLTNGSTNWDCQNLKCNCIPKTTFCGGGGVGDITGATNPLSGALSIECDDATTCAFKQSTLQSLFGADGLSLSGCSFGECVAQSVIDTSSTNSTDTSGGGGDKLSGGGICSLAAVGSLVFLALAFLVFGLLRQRSARRAKPSIADGSRVAVEWSRVTYVVSGRGNRTWFGRRVRGSDDDDKVVLDAVTGRVAPGQMMAVLGPSGAGKTTLSGTTTGRVSFPSAGGAPPRIGFVPQQDVLPPMLTVYEVLLFGARLRLPESVSDAEKRERIEGIMETLGIAPLRNVRIGWGGDIGGGKARGISGGEMRRVSIGLELIASPDVLILDEPTSGLDSVFASRVAKVLHAIAHHPENPIHVIASIHQPSSQLYQIFDPILVMSHGRALYAGPGGFAPAEYFAREAPGVAPPYQQEYNVTDYLLKVASDPPPGLFQLQSGKSEDGGSAVPEQHATKPAGKSKYSTTFLTQLQYLSGREWKILRRDKTLFFTHVVISSLLGVFCGLYFQTGITIAGFQSRIGCLFFLVRRCSFSFLPRIYHFSMQGALIVFSSLSALYNIVEIHPLFLPQRRRLLFDVVPLQIIPTIIVATITYWMAGLAHDPAHYFKFLFPTHKATENGAETSSQILTQINK